MSREAKIARINRHINQMMMDPNVCRFRRDGTKTVLEVDFDTSIVQNMADVYTAGNFRDLVDNIVSNMLENLRIWE